MKITSRSIVRKGILFGLVALVAACSNTANKGAIPPDGVPAKKVTNGQQVAFNPGIDILFVVDDSGSMSSHQANLSNNIKKFTAELQKTAIVDYHIGVVTTSMDGETPGSGCDYNSPWGGSGRVCGDGRLVRFKTKVPFIDPKTPNGLSILEDNLLVGTSGAGEEMAFDPVVAALSPPMENTVNAGFLRPNASLAIIFVTDAEDQSDANPTGQGLYNFLLNLKGGRPDKILTYGAIIPSSQADPTCPRDNGNDAPLRIEDFLKIAGGTEYDLCDPDYGTKLASIAKDVVQKVGRIMYLSRLPIPGTIVVTYGSQIIPEDPDTGWQLDTSRNALILGEKIKFSNQPPGTSLSVTFTAGTI